MRRFAAFASVFALPLAADAQTPAVSANPTPSPAFQMPGTSVGTPLLRPVGTQLPKAAPAAGTPVGQTPGNTIPTDPTLALPGPKIDLKNVVAPLPESSNLPTEPTLWDKFMKKFGVPLGLIAPEPKAPNYTPGIARRNRERAHQRVTEAWRRD